MSKEVGDIIQHKNGSLRFRIMAICSGSWSGERYYECQNTVEPWRSTVYIYDDESELVKKFRK